MGNDIWKNLGNALDQLSEARKAFKEWLIVQFPGLVMHRPFDNANCATGSIGVVCDVDGNDVYARFVWRGVFIEIMWGLCASSSYYHVRQIGRAHV